LWLPANGWTGRYESVGNGGFAGSIRYGHHPLRQRPFLREVGSTWNLVDGSPVFARHLVAGIGASDLVRLR